jgi:hypothetical protein
MDILTDQTIHFAKYFSVRVKTGTACCHYTPYGAKKNAYGLNNGLG